MVKDYTGQIINGVFIEKDLGMLYATSTSKRKAHYIVIKCIDCKNMHKMLVGSLQKGQKKCYHCGHIYKQRIIKHGGCGTRLYKIWTGIKRRCYSKGASDYTNYGNRGISVCREWQNDFIPFRDWATTHGYSNKLTIDRINNDGNYEPFNCRWITRRENNLNSRFMRADNTSGYRGISWHKVIRKWEARIAVRNKDFNLGCYTTKQQAAMAYDNYIINHNLTGYKTNKEYYNEK